MPSNPIQIDTTQAQAGTVLDLLTEDGVPKPFLVQPLSGSDIAFGAAAVDWNTPPPANLEAALDILAAIVPVQFAAGALGALATLTFTTPAQVPFKSGRYLVIATVDSTASVASQQTANLLADAATIDSSQSGTGGAGNSPPNVMIAVVALNKLVTHTFTVNITASVGTLTSPAGGLRIVALEF